MNDKLRFRRHSLPVGEDHIPVLVGSEGEQPRAVFMSYDAFLELAATLYTAIEALKAAGVEPSEIFADDEEAEDLDTEDEPPVSEADLAEFSAWDEEFAVDETPARPQLRLVVGG